MTSRAPNLRRGITRLEIVIIVGLIGFCGGLFGFWPGTVLLILLFGWIKYPFDVAGDITIEPVAVLTILSGNGLIHMRNLCLWEVDRERNLPRRTATILDILTIRAVGSTDPVRLRRGNIDDRDRASDHLDGHNRGEFPGKWPSSRTPLRQ